MYTFITRFLKKVRKPTSNQQGSVLSVTLIVVAMLSFSITTLTSNTVNLSSTTTMMQENMEDTSLSKKLIDVTIADVKTKLSDYATEENPLIAYFEDFSDSDDGVLIYTDADGVSPYIVHKDTGVTIKADMDFDGMDYDSQLPIKFTHSALSKYVYFLIVPGSGLDGGIGNGAISDILQDPPSGDYEVWDEETAGDYSSDNYSEGDIVYAEGEYYVRTDRTNSNSNLVPWDYTGNGNGNGWFKDWVPYDGEVPQDGFDPERDYEINFYFSLVTNGDMYLNSGLYNIPSIFANNIYSSVTSVYELNNDFDFKNPNTSFNDELYPDFMVEEDMTKVFLQGDYNYCSSATTSACVDVIEDGAKVEFDRREYGLIESNNSDDFGAVQSVMLENFFESYVFNEELLTYINESAPTAERIISDVVTLTDIENRDLSNLLGLSGDIQQSPVYSNNGKWLLYYDYICPTNTDFCNITPYASEFLNLNNQDVSAIYNGNLTLTDSYNSSEEHTLVVLGDLTINMSGDQSIVGNILVTGDTTFIGDSVRFQGTLTTLGQTIVNFDNNEGFFVSETQPKNFTLLSRDNLIINSIYKNSFLDENDNEFYGFLYTEESIYINAVNSNINLNGSLYARATNAPSSTDLPFVDETGAAINGIIINSIFGYFDGSTTQIANNIETKSLYTRFIQQDISDDAIQDQFSNLPWFQVGVQGETAFIEDGFEEE